MNALSVSMSAGLLFFLAIYLPFGYWQTRIWSPIAEEAKRGAQLAQDLFRKRTVDEHLRLMLASGFLCGLVLFWLMWPVIWMALPLSVAAFFVGIRIPRIYLEKFVQPKRIALFSVQMVDALTLMGNGLKSGLNVPQTLQIVVDEMPVPIKEEFDLVLKETRLGRSLEEAFQNMGRRIASDDVSMFVTSVVILMETGGNLAETFQNITKTIRERLKLQGKIQAMTAQGMTSAFIVSALPWALAAMLYMVDPENVRPLFTTLPGWGILLVVITLEAIGFFIILKVVKIRV